MGEHREVFVVRTGTWLYDGAVPMAVEILQQNWDYYLEEDFDDEPPVLNDAGLAFYVVYGGGTSRSRTCLSLQEAVELAAATVGDTLVWNEREPESNRR